MLDPLFTSEDVQSLRNIAEAIAEDFEPPDAFLVSVASRIQQYLDQQARTITIPLDRAIQAGSSVVSMTWSDGTPVSSKVAERILAGLPIPEGTK